MIDVILWFYMGVTILGTLVTIARVGREQRPLDGSVAVIVTVMNVVFVWALSTKLVQG